MLPLDRIATVVRIRFSCLPMMTLLTSAIKAFAMPLTWPINSLERASPATDCIICDLQSALLNVWDSMSCRASDPATAPEVVLRAMDPQEVIHQFLFSWLDTSFP